jgi:cyclohexyl-isocyanide hydratase
MDGGCPFNLIMMTQRKSIGIVIFPEFQLLDVAGPLELFGASDGVQPLLIAARRDPVSPVLWQHHTITPEFDFTSAPHLDVLFVPGGPGIRHAIACSETRAFLRERSQKATYITSVCTGALVLGAAGLLVGYRAATHWLYMPLLEMCGAIPVDGRVVKDRNRITSGGVTAGIDFGLHLIAALTNQREAEKAQLRLQYAPAPPFQSGEPHKASDTVALELRNEASQRFREREQLLANILAER